MFLFLTVAASPAAAQSSYGVIDLGSASGTWSAAYSINESGQVAGSTLVTQSDWSAFLWQNGVMTLLPPPTIATSFYGQGINGKGEVVGFDDLARALVWSAGSGHDIGGLGGGYNGAMAINDTGQVAGRSRTRNGEERAFLWQRGGMIDLGTLSGVGNSEAFAINQAGQIAGGATTVSGDYHAFLWQNGQMTDLGSLGGRLATAYGINDQGLVVGSSWTGSAIVHSHAFVRNASQMIDIGTLQGPDGYSTAWDVNNYGQVVGESSAPGESDTHAFLYQHGAILDLNDLIPPGTGWLLMSATSINDCGQIVGFGRQNGSTWRRAFLLEPSGNGTLVLSGPVPGAAGVPNTLTVQQATPGAQVWFVYGQNPGAGRVPGCPGLHVGLAAPEISAPQTADSAGVASISAIVPANATGKTVLFQAVERSSCRTSNLVTHLFP